MEVHRRAFSFQVAMGVDAGRPLTMIRMIVAPGPVFALLGRRQLAEIAIRPGWFADPLAVIDDFVMVPDVIIVAGRVVNPGGGAFGAARKQHWCQQRYSQQDDSEHTNS